MQGIAGASYRDRLRGPHVTFVYLAGSSDEIRNRLSARMNHYMPSTLLDSQLACLDPPAADGRVVTIGVAARPAEIAAEIIRRLTLRPEPFSSALGASAPGYSSAPPLGDFWKSGRLLEIDGPRRVTVTDPGKANGPGHSSWPVSFGGAAGNRIRRITRLDLRRR